MYSFFTVYSFYIVDIQYRGVYSGSPLSVSLYNPASPTFQSADPRVLFWRPVRGQKTGQEPFQGRVFGSSGIYGREGNKGGTTSRAGEDCSRQESGGIHGVGEEARLLLSIAGLFC